MTECTVLGILDDGWEGLGAAARARLTQAACVIGVGRTLELVAPHLAPGCATRDMDGKLTSAPAWVKEERAAGRSVAVLATGDPLCHGIAGYLVAKLGAAAVEVLPAVSTVQLACARLKCSWQGARILSVHGADASEWAWGALPSHGLYELVRAVEDEERIVCFTGPANSPDRIARALVAAGYGDEWRLSVAACLLLPDEQLFVDLAPAEAAQRSFPDPNVVVLERCAPRRESASFGHADADYVQRQPRSDQSGGLITKREARAVSLALLAVTPGDTLWDIGAGSGSVGLEAARLARRGHVWAIEKNAADADNARENARRRRATNYTLAEGRAPTGLDAWPDPDAVFVGGSGGELDALIELVWTRLKPGGRFVLNFVTFENLAAATAALKRVGAAWQVTQLQAARSQPILDMNRLAAENPVWIVSATKDQP